MLEDGIIVILILVLSAYLITNKEQEEEATNENKKSKKKRKKDFILLGVFLICIISLKTLFRTKTKSIISNSTFVNKIASYMADGIGCLDLYLKNPVTVNYPQYFFRIPFLITNMLGITNISTDVFINTYKIPFASNVITYIGELYHDFQYGLFAIIFILSAIYSYSYYVAKKTNYIFYKILFAVLSVIFFLSFFSYFGRSNTVCIALILGGICAIFIDFRRSKKTEEK